MNLRVDEHDKVVTEGEQVQIGHHSYVSVCSLHFDLKQPYKEEVKQSEIPDPTVAVGELSGEMVDNGSGESSKSERKLPEEFGGVGSEELPLKTQKRGPSSSMGLFSATSLPSTEKLESTGLGNN